MMLRRYGNPGEWKADQAPATRNGQLQRDLAQAIDESVVSISTKVQAIIEERKDILKDEA